jgi:hypothetical protein
MQELQGKSGNSESWSSGTHQALRLQFAIAVEIHQATMEKQGENGQLWYKMEDLGVQMHCTHQSYTPHTQFLCAMTAVYLSMGNGTATRIAFFYLHGRFRTMKIVLSHARSTISTTSTFQPIRSSVPPSPIPTPSIPPPPPRVLRSPTLLHCHHIHHTTVNPFTKNTLPRNTSVHDWVSSSLHNLEVMSHFLHRLHVNHSQLLPDHPLLSHIHQLFHDAKMWLSGELGGKARLTGVVRLITAAFLLPHHTARSHIWEMGVENWCTTLSAPKYPLH